MKEKQTMKRIVALLVVVCAVMGFTACGATGMTVTICGEKYDITEDLQENVGDMVENGVIVVSDLYLLYDENGKYNFDGSEQVWGETIGKACQAYETELKNSPESCTVLDFYCLSSYFSYDFETEDGITEKSDGADLERLEGYVRQNSSKGIAVAAIYMDGKKVELKQYEDLIDEWVECVNEKGLLTAQSKYFHENGGSILDCSQVLNSLYYAMEMKGIELETMLADETLYLEDELLMNFAASEAMDLLYKGKIDSYDVVFYEYVEETERMSVSYYHYYYDKNWDKDKFYSDK